MAKKHWQLIGYPIKLLAEEGRDKEVSEEEEEENMEDVNEEEAKV